ncbi:hypothetical protein [Occallatibacter riparius]|uniref:Uncharacterized protein n=1 Tax=Occallatibacter riparius TaxID=1002689 RepID=A0A9J7BRQ6_9BACT|nr:hypothetical protein [Occallatibacter riparius]UWZ85255.1 hypothetical protein MOP44_04765 [Occallatibacter riparius]
MSIDDPVDAHLQSLKQDLEANIADSLGAPTLAGILSLIPGVGAAVQSLLGGRAQRNVQRRWIELFLEMKKRIEQARASIPDHSYYGSEEFQTLLALAQEQLWTTHDKDKLRLLAIALANSGVDEFRGDDKELMLRALRTISPSDLRTLDHENLKGWLPLTNRFEYSDEILGSLSRLASLGLVTEKFLRPDPNASDEQKLHSVLHFGPRRTFQLSPFGQRFMRFVAAQDGQQDETALP